MSPLTSPMSPSIDKQAFLPTHHSPTRHASSGYPSRRRGLWVVIACTAAFIVWVFTSPERADASSPDPNLHAYEGAGAPIDSDRASSWRSWKPWLSSGSIWGLGRHDSTRSDLSGGLPHDPSLWESPTRPLPLNATLEERLKSWSEAPIPEPAEWVQFNLKTCSDHRITKNGNMELLKKSHLLWASMNSTHVRQKRNELITYMRQAQSSGLLASERQGVGRGLVFTAGNADTFDRVLLTLRMFREHLKVDYPAEIFSFPGEEPSDETREALRAVNATLHVVEGAERDKKRNKNFHIKASALVQCSFREPLYLDSDNLPAIVKPGQFEQLWESKSYRKLGALFWPDFWKSHADIPVWILIGTQCRDEWEQEAGQILIDKSKHLDALLLSEYMLKDWQYWFNLSDGDKDIFRFAMLALRKRWAWPGRFLGAAGLSWNTMTGYCGHTMLQHDVAGRPLFVHMNLLKQIPSGVYRGTTFKRTRSFKLPTIGEAASGAAGGESTPEHLEDLGVEADQLANAAVDGTAIDPAPPAVRQRAALELGLRPYLHGGGMSAICSEVEWADPRTETELEVDKRKWLQAHDSPSTSPAFSPLPTHITPADEGAVETQAAEGDDIVTEIEPDLTYTEAADGLRIQWQDPMETLQWNDDDRLKDFEDRFFDMGGKTNGNGF